jgi:hypothetical protein
MMTEARQALQEPRTCGCRIADMPQPTRVAVSKASTYDQKQAP